MSLGVPAAVATALLAATPVGAAFVTPGTAGASPQLRGPGAVGQAVGSAATVETQAGWTVGTSGASAAVLTAAAAYGVISIAAARRARAAIPLTGRRLMHLAAFESELGVQDPVGFWDPLGFASDGDVTAFKRRRSVELKHGRICMLATMGYITPELTGKWPGDLSPSEGVKFADIPNGLAAISKVPALGWAQIVAYCGFCELSAGSDDWKTGTPGNFGWKVLTSSDPEERQKKLSAEIANGRLAMVAIIGMFFQDGLTGSAWGDWALYTDSPLR
uniref:Chlorophyll A-C binding protein n=1 Tax=Pyrocystis lunula TaxID=2972 RepID=Q8GZE4_PYRLU|nr:chlorophyll A-C binding protein [Pyrocystis lunula]